MCQPTTLTATTKSVTLTITVIAKAGRAVGLVNGFIGSLETVNGRNAIHFDAKAIKALTGQKVDGGAYIAVDRALTAGEVAAVVGAAAGATPAQRNEAACFILAAASGAEVVISRSVHVANGYTIESFRVATPAGTIRNTSNNTF